MSTLNKHEMAAITSSVPCTGDAAIDKIISVSLRYKTASAFMESLILNYPTWEPAALAKEAVTYADALLAAFNGKEI